jgi:transposase
MTSPNLRLLKQPLSPEEIITLENMAKNHPYADFHRRALALLALNEGRTVVEIAALLRISDQPIYNWAKQWRELGLAGILNGHKGGHPRKVTDAMQDTVIELARSEPLTLRELNQKLRARLPEAPQVSNDTIRNILKKHGFSFKRNRLSLKKSVMKPPLPQ